MLQSPVAFLETLEPKCCGTCGEVIEEYADCYHNICYNCTDTTFYALSPVFITLFNPVAEK
ncbi:protein YhfH [Paenibacillus thalictri]|uniref:YhfH family protein n=1 Tax=Paenibacillus thalictri TaxID=2527873 RepID=A0A4Q9DL89_9BACL|nr:protein YhfH [Paenibacillus thalictri]TBL75769.1 YhfH family protein [Paenibacillus thalictri]